MSAASTLHGLAGAPGPATLVLALPGGAEVLRFEETGIGPSGPVVAAYVNGRRVNAPVVLAEALKQWSIAYGASFDGPPQSGPYGRALHHGDDAPESERAGAPPSAAATHDGAVPNEWSPLKPPRLGPYVGPSRRSP